jgi:serine/threonine protein kinase
LGLSFRFNRKYDLFEDQKLGEGSSSRVVLALNKINRRRYAVKQLMSSQGEAAEQVAIVRKEYNLLRSLKHENIIRVYDLYDDEITGVILISFERVKMLTNIPMNSLR